MGYKQVNSQPNFPNYCIWKPFMSSNIKGWTCSDFLDGEMQLCLSLGRGGGEDRLQLSQIFIKPTDFLNIQHCILTVYATHKGRHLNLPSELKFADFSEFSEGEVDGITEANFRVRKGVVTLAQNQTRRLVYILYVIYAYIYSSPMSSGTD